MKKLTRIILSIIGLGLILVYFLPVWDIALEAPQYPEGLGFEIWIYKMTGDLNTVNGLNHYIGMKKIEPDSIKELQFMPYLLGLLILLLALTIYKAKKSLLVVWVSLMIVFGIAGGIDFYVWEYDYGHNIDPNAIIKVPGMNYQPPLIGSKQLLNFTAQSLPDIGAYLAFAAGALLLFVIIRERKSTPKI